MKKGDKFFELVCITSPEYAPNEEIEVTLGYYSSRSIINKEKKICEKQVENYHDLRYTIKEHKIVL